MLTDTAKEATRLAETNAPRPAWTGNAAACILYTWLGMRAALTSSTHRRPILSLFLIYTEVGKPTSFSPPPLPLVCVPVPHPKPRCAFRPIVITRSEAS